MSAIDTGCYVDGLWGVYVPHRTYEIATGFGYNGDPITEAHCREAADYADEVCEEIVDWLNTNVAATDYSFGWYEGGLYYWADSDWQEAYLK